MSSTVQSVMKYNDERRVLVSLNASDNALSIVDHPKDVIQRLFQRRPSRSLELSAIRSLSVSGAELSIGVADGEVLKLECASLADGETWYVLFFVYSSCPCCARRSLSGRHCYLLCQLVNEISIPMQYMANAGMRACAFGADRQSLLARVIRATPSLAHQRLSAQS